MCRRGHLNERSRHGKGSAVRVRPGWGRPVYGSIPRGNQGGSGGSFTAPGVGMNRIWALRRPAFSSVPHVRGDEPGSGLMRCQGFSGVALFLSFGGGETAAVQGAGRRLRRSGG